MKDDYPTLSSFIREGTLYIGDAYDENYSTHVKFVFGRNIINHNLEYKTADDIKYQVKVTSKNDNGKDTSVTVGDKDGDQRTFTDANKSQSELKELANKYLGLVKFSGYRGDFTAFGEPMVRHGYVAVLSGSERKEQDGSYWIDGVKKTFGGGKGYRQVITLGKKAG